MEQDPKTVQYYVLRGQNTEGPLSKDALFSMRSEGLISDETLICRVGDTQWTATGVLFPSTKQAAPPPPPPSSSAPAVPPQSGQRSQEDRELLREYLVAVIQSEIEAEAVKGIFKNIWGTLLGRSDAVVAGTTVTDAEKENTKREALFQIHRLLNVSANYLGTAPWITYLTAKRHAKFTQCYGIATTAFAAFGDKKLVDEAALIADALEVKASAMMDSETTANIQELINFQERQLRLPSAISILKAIITSPHRSLILKRLNGKQLSISRNTISMPDGSREAAIATFCAVACPVVAIACWGFAGIADKKNHGALFMIGIVLFSILAVAAMHCFSESSKAKRMKEEAIANEEARIRAILRFVDGSVANFKSKVEPLLRELQIAVTLDDLERMISELEKYGNWGRELESYYIKT